MKPMISEFSYGYALTEELASGKIGRIVGAPVFPSLIAEGRPGGGYDLELPREGAPLFLQFKLSHYMKTSNATEWGRFFTRYYRMYLRPLRHSLQHNLLLDLENQGKEVYYVAPLFHKMNELNEAYMDNEVFEKSAFFRPLDIGSLPDEKEHYVAFSKRGHVAYVCSDEPKKTKKYDFGLFIESQVGNVTQNHHKIDKQFFDQIAYDIIRILNKRHIEIDHLREFQARNQQLERSLNAKAQFAAFLTRSYFDAEFFVINDQSES